MFSNEATGIPSTFAFYGSLRRGMENHSLHENHLKYLFSARLNGYRLFSKNKFPFAVESSKNYSVTVEVFRIADESTIHMIHKLEMDEGYHLKVFDLEGERVGIYLFDAPGNYPEVPDGDWVTFFREKSGSR